MNARCIKHSGELASSGPAAADSSLVTTSVTGTSPGQFQRPNRSPRTSDLRNAYYVCISTARSYIIRHTSYIVDVIRWPLYPTMYFLTLILAYHISGRANVGGFGVSGYLLVGTIGVVLWQSNLWSGGYAIEFERYGGTINALYLTPASRAAVVLGYSLGSLAVWILPNSLILAGVAWACHINANVSDPLAVIVCFACLVVATFALGFAVAGIFVMSRRANLMANFFQSPIYLLSGMIVPISALPGSMRVVATLFPLSAGMDALRRSLLSGASTADVSADLARLLLLSAALFIFGLFMLRRVENVAKRGGELDFD